MEQTAGSKIWLWNWTCKKHVSDKKDIPDFDHEQKHKIQDFGELAYVVCECWFDQIFFMQCSGTVMLKNYI